MWPRGRFGHQPSPLTFSGRPLRDITAIPDGTPATPVRRDGAPEPPSLLLPRQPEFFRRGRVGSQTGAGAELRFRQVEAVALRGECGVDQIDRLIERKDR